jgi:(2Fe-2S) ferredoxin
MRYPYEKLFLVCTGARCNDDKHGKNAGLEIRETLKSYNKSLGRKSRVRICSVSCIDMCEEGPNMVVEPGHEFYRDLTRAKAKEIYDRVMGEE